MSDNLFSNFTTDKLDEQAQDRLGGFQVLDSDIYTGTIKLAYLLKADSGALGIYFDFDLEGGKKYSPTVYFTNKKGEHFFFTKEKKKAPQMGFTLVNDICLIATGAEFAQQKHEKKTVNVYNRDLKKEVPTEVPVLVDLIGQKVALGVFKLKENKSEKGADGEYHPTSEIREVNAIDKVFHPEAKITVNEARLLKEGEKPTPKFWPAWETKNKGHVIDKTDKTLTASAVGGPPAAASGPPASGQSGGQRPSLFGKKKD